jgi:hypothetical protein
MMSRTPLVLTVGSPILAKYLKYEISLAEVASITAAVAEATRLCVGKMQMTDIRFFSWENKAPPPRALIDDDFIYEEPHE